jgi:hypothetical protein
MKHLTVNNLFDSISFCEAQGLAKVFQAYADHCAGEEIFYEGVGFNSHSGYVYIALENGITIASCMGQDVDYIMTNFDTGHEQFFDSYEEAANFQF